MFEFDPIPPAVLGCLQLLDNVLGPLIVKLLQLSQNATGMLLLSDGAALNVASSRMLYEELLSK